MKLGKRQEKVLSTLTVEPKTAQEISELTGIELHKVKNILMELCGASISNRTVNNTYHLCKTMFAPRNDSDDKNLWEPIKLKNLSRVV